MVTPKIRNGLLDVRMVTPKIRNGLLDVRMVTPKIRNDLLDVRMVTPKIRNGLLGVRMVTPKIRNGLLDVRMVIPKIRNGLLDVRMVTPRRYSDGHFVLLGPTMPWLWAAPPMVRAAPSCPTHRFGICKNPAPTCSFGAPVLAAFWVSSLTTSAAV